MPYRVPQHDVGIVDRPILLGPLHQPVASAALVGVITRPVLLVVAVRRDPDVVVDEAGPPSPPRIRRRERKRVVTGDEPLGNRLAHTRLDAALADLRRPT